MISLSHPTRAATERRLESLASAPHSYPEVGATGDGAQLDRLSAKYNIDRHSTVIARTGAGFEASKSAIRAWAPFALPWIEVVASGEPEVGRTVAVVARVVGLWWINVSRVVYTIDETHRFGFAYGTLECHAESGEELFLVEFDPATEDVTYSVVAFSRPRHVLARLGYPFSRRVQRRFGRETLVAMEQETARLRANPDPD